MMAKKDKKKDKKKEEEQVSKPDGRPKQGVLNKEYRPRIINCSKFGKLGDSDEAPMGLQEDNSIYIEPGPGSITFIDKELWERAKTENKVVQALLDKKVLVEKSEAARNVMDPVA